MTPQEIFTPRLKLIASTPSLLTLEMNDIGAFATLLGVLVPEDWPPGEYDSDAIRFFIGKLTEGGAEAAGWYGWYTIKSATPSEAAALVGCGGYLGPPDETGAVEIGYSLCERYRGRGLARELVAALVDNAIRRGGTKIVAHTTHDNPASIRVLANCGFWQVTGTDSAMLRFEHVSER